MTGCPSGMKQPDLIETSQIRASQTRDDALRAIRTSLAAHGIDDPAHEARLLCVKALSIDSTALITAGDTPLSEFEVDRLNDWLGRRVAREPLGRIVGYRDFWGFSFKLGPDTLEPRPDTECLVEAVLGWVDQNGGRDKAWRLVDVGTGTGCIAVSLLHELPNAVCMAIDISPGALHIARENAETAGVGERFFPTCGSFLDSVTCCDFIVSNPPYIVSSVIETLSDEVRFHDPLQALDGGRDGLDAYKAILQTVGRNRINELRAVFLEIGFDQAGPVSYLVEHHCHQTAQLVRDLGQQNRVVWFDA